MNVWGLLSFCLCFFSCPLCIIICSQLILNDLFILVLFNFGVCLQIIQTKNFHICPGVKVNYISSLTLRILLVCIENSVGQVHLKHISLALTVEGWFFPPIFLWHYVPAECRQHGLQRYCKVHTASKNLFWMARELLFFFNRFWTSKVVLNWPLCLASIPPKGILATVNCCAKNCNAVFPLSSTKWFI